MVDSTPLKRCSKCRQFFPLSEFHKDRTRKDGLHDCCKACSRLASVRYYKEHREQAIKRAKEWSQKHPEKIKESQKKYVINHRERRLETQRVYRENNNERLRIESRKRYVLEREKKRDYARQYYSEHPEKAKIYVLRRRALKRALPSSFTSVDWSRCLEYWHGRCAICGRPPGLWHTLAADHWIPLSSPDCPGNIAKNILPLCHGVDGCNNSKIGKNPDEWLIEKLGKKKAAAKLTEIADYFDWL